MQMGTKNSLSSKQDLYSGLSLIPLNAFQNQVRPPTRRICQIAFCIVFPAPSRFHENLIPFKSQHALDSSNLQTSRRLTLLCDPWRPLKLHSCSQTFLGSSFWDKCKSHQQAIRCWTSQNLACILPRVYFSELG